MKKTMSQSNNEITKKAQEKKLDLCGGMTQAKI